MCIRDSYYSIAKMFHMIEEQGNDHKFNFKAVWQKQAISKATENQLVDIIYKVYGILTDESRGIQNAVSYTHLISARGYYRQ